MIACVGLAAVGVACGDSTTGVQARGTVSTSTSLATSSSVVTVWMGSSGNWSWPACHSGLWDYLKGRVHGSGYAYRYGSDIYIRDVVESQCSKASSVWNSFWGTKSQTWQQNLGDDLKSACADLRPVYKFFSYIPETVGDVPQIVAGEGSAKSPSNPPL